ncbi:MAG: DNA gyrase subunit A [Candidatus Schekmanbacteria bacterium]|nr:DNA gyrase subunit A [Candidatus Schekmanbacteria bacterium]
MTTSKNDPTADIVRIEDEMKGSFLDYAMSVIVARALPDVRDGLKPVHRRILVTLRDLGLNPDRGFRKCAKICGDVSGNYHPHGESIVYPSLVRLGQDFSLRYPLVWGQGNFGSIDGDPPAAMRYTEAKMSHICLEMLRDIDKDTVEFVPNYDETREEPSVLPSALPNLLVNGSSGIAVGMATNIPPHNLGEIVDALVALIDRPYLQLSDILEFVKGPDFPTGATIYGRAGILAAYRTGRGKVTIRARAETETDERTDRLRIVVSEIPYQVNKTALIEKIAELVREKRIEGISDLRDESDREGMRIVIDLKRGAMAEVVLNQLYKFSPLQTTFGINLLALVNARPRIMPLRDLMTEFLKHRQDVIVRRCRFELEKHRRRAHILEGLLKALDHLDEVITLIRESESPAEAKERLMQRFEMTDVQAQAILDMRLQRLTGLERRKLAEEHEELKIEMARLLAILESDERQMNVIREELLALRAEFADARRTALMAESVEVGYEDLVAEEDVVVLVTRDGYAKRTPLSEYRAQGRAGIGVSGIETKEGDVVEHVLLAANHDNLLVFTDQGRVYGMKVYSIPEAGRQAKGRALVNLLELSPNEKAATILNVPEFVENLMVVFVTTQGHVKKTSLTAYQRIQRGGLAAITLREDDRLIRVVVTDGERDLLLVTAKGKAIRFSEQDVRAMGRSAQGVIGIRLAQEDHVVACVELGGEEDILTVSERGMGRRTGADQYRVQSRGGLGINNLKVNAKTGVVIGAVAVQDGDELILISADGKLIRLHVSSESIRPMGRYARGVRLVRVVGDDRVAAVCRYAGPVATVVAAEAGEAVPVAEIPEEDFDTDTDIDPDSEAGFEEE